MSREVLGGGQPEYFAVYWTDQFNARSMNMFLEFKAADEYRRELTRTTKPIYDDNRLLGEYPCQPQAKGPVCIARFKGEWL